MGKQTKLREAQRRATEQALAVRLRTHTPARDGPAFINTFAEFAPLYRERLAAYCDQAVRPPQAWHCGLRVRSPEQRFRDLVRFSFAKYPIPLHLENAWLEEPEGDWAVDGAARPDFRHWSIIVGRGGSLYREVARPFLTKIETHHFVTAPAAVTSTQRAFWFAFSRALTDDEVVALRIARTKLVRFAVSAPLWKEAVRFFVDNPVPTHEMNDLIDYFQAAHHADESFTLAGRSLPALRRLMEHWHRLKREEASGLRWPGQQRPDARYETEIAGERAIWRFTQIKTSRALVDEGHKMQHCVGCYQQDCTDGLLSIWSLTCECRSHGVRKCLTIELDRFGRIGQCRGFANRLPTAAEDAIVRHWAAAHGIGYESVLGPAPEMVEIEPALLAYLEAV